MKANLSIIKFLKFAEDKTLPVYEAKRIEDLKCSGTLKTHVSNQAENPIASAERATRSTNKVRLTNCIHACAN